jgi:hypothetical protein
VEFDAPGNRRMVDAVENRQLAPDHPARLRQRLLRTGGRLIKHARRYWPLLDENHLTRPLFGAMVR